MAARRIATLDDDSAFVVATFRCNNDCRFCSTHSRGFWKRSPDKGGVFEFVDEAVARGCRYLEFGGGEVTILPWFEALLERAKGRFEHVAILSNGRRFADPAFCRRVVDLGLRRVGVSFHGSTAALHDRLSRAPGAFDESLAGIRNLTALGESGAPLGVWVTTTVLADNLPDLVALGWLLRDAGVRTWRLKAPHGRGNVFPFGAATADLRAALAAHADALSVETEDVPLCVLGPWAQQSSSLGARPDVGIAGQSVQDRAASLRQRPLPPPCVDCAAASLCPRPAPPYLRRFGHGDLRPLDAAAAAALRATAEAARQPATEAAEGASPPVSSAAMVALAEHARAGAWQMLRDGCDALLAAAPDHDELRRLRRLAEGNLLSDEARRLAAAGDRAGSERVLARLHAEYRDVLGPG